MGSSRRPRVLFMAKHLDSGGVTTQMMALGRGLQRRGWEVAVASGGIHGSHQHGPEWFERSGIRHYWVPFPDFKVSAPNVLKATLSVGGALGAVQRFQPSLIHVHWRVASRFAWIAKKLFGSPVIVTLQLFPIPSERLHRIFSFWGDVTVAVSQETAAHLANDFGVPRQKIRVINNCVDENWFRPASSDERESSRRSLGLRSSDSVVCLVGRLERVKGHHILLKALRNLRDSGLDVVAVCAGEGSLKAEIRAEAQRMGIGDLVYLVGFREIREVYWASDVCVLPSRLEGFPVCIVEAMMCGVVPIRTPAAGAREQISDGIDGFIIPFDDASALSARIQLLLSDSSLRQRMGAAAMAKARLRFSAETMSAKIADLYDELVATNADRSSPQPLAEATTDRREAG